MTRRSRLPYFLTLSQVCELTGKSPVTIWRWVRRGTFPEATFGGLAGVTRLGWKRDEVRAWLRSR